MQSHVASQHVFSALFFIAIIALWIAICRCREWRLKCMLALEERDNFESDFTIAESISYREALRSGNAATQRALLASHTNGCSPGRCANDYGTIPELTAFKCSMCGRMVGLCMGASDNHPDICDDCVHAAAKGPDPIPIPIPVTIEDESKVQR